MQLTRIGELFLSRILQLNEEVHVKIAIGKLQKFPDGKDYYCPCT
jgi:hypothetical protein